MGLIDLGRDVAKTNDLAAAKKAAKPKRQSAPTAATAVDDACRRVRAQLGRYASRYLLFMDKDRDAFKSFVDKCVDNGIVAIDTETNNKTHFLPTDLMAGFSLTTCDLANPDATMVNCYVPLNHRSYWTKVRLQGQMDLAFAKEQLLRLTQIKTVWQNAKFDYMEFMLRHNVRFAPWWDTMIAAHLLNENEPHGLKYLYAKYVAKNEDEVFSFASLFDNMKFPDIPVDVGGIYAAHDTEMTMRLFLYQKEYLLDNPSKYDLDGVSNCFFNVEMPIIPCVGDMELRGVLIDSEYAGKLSVEYTAKLKDAEQRYALECSKHREAIMNYQKSNPGKLEDTPNYQSPKQLAIFLYDVLKVGEIDKKSPRGTGEEILEKIGGPICDLILECRGYNKLLGTYINKLPACVDANGYIHGSFNQCGSEDNGVVTGRFSSSDPNLQNIPSHDDKIRKMFSAREGYVLVGGDYSQQEPHVMAQVAQDLYLKKAYDEDRDVYAEMASLATGRAYNDCREFLVNPDGSWQLDAVGHRIENKEGHAVRSQFKAIFLGLLYGKQTPALAEDLGVSKQAAQKIIESLYKAFPNIKGYIDWNLDKARKLGHVDTLWGRRRHLPDMMLPKYGITEREGFVKDFNPLAFDVGDEGFKLTKADIARWEAKMEKAYGRQKADVVAEAYEQGVVITDNSMKVADAERQCCNSVVQGSAADMTKVAMKLIYFDPLLNELDYHLLIPVHDELIGECPRENVGACAKRVQELMIQACNEKVHMKTKVDVEVTKVWTGEPIAY